MRVWQFIVCVFLLALLSAWSDVAEAILLKPPALVRVRNAEGAATSSSSALDITSALPAE